MEKSESINELAAALVKFQGAVSAVCMNRKVKMSYEKNGKWFDKSYSYADLGAIFEAIRKPLSESGLAVSQFPSVDNQDVVVKTILMHTSGQFLEETIKMRPVDSKIQSIGSTITYGKRYSLSAMLGISTEEDDDGSAGNGNDKPIDDSDQQQPADRRPPPQRTAAPARPAANPRPTGRSMSRPAPAPESDNPDDDLPWKNDPPAALGTTPPLPDQNKLAEQSDLLRLKAVRLEHKVDADAMCEYAQKEFGKADPVAMSVAQINTLIEAIKKYPEVVNKGMGF